MAQDETSLSFRQSFYVALGSNQPHGAHTSHETLINAFESLQEYSLELVRRSRFFKTPAFPANSGPDFVNAVAEFRGTSAPQEILDILHEVERRLGRQRLERWGARTLDLDLLAVGDVIAPSRHIYLQWRDLPLSAQISEAPDTLILPHPRIQDRSFVLVPWAEIAPEWRHPVIGKTVCEMCEARPEEERKDVVPMEAARG